jgi:hypothetical protein
MAATYSMAVDIRPKIARLRRALFDHAVRRR